MFLFWLLIIVLLIYFVIRPLWRGYRLYRQMQDSAAPFREAFENMRRAQEETFRKENKKKKKIDPEVGEYVAFEEISEETKVTDQTGTKTTVRTESQIEDAVWEEIK